MRFRKRWLAGSILVVRDRITSRFSARLPGGFGIITHEGPEIRPDLPDAVNVFPVGNEFLIKRTYRKEVGRSRKYWLQGV